MGTTAATDGLNEMAFPQPALTREDNIVLTTNELPRAQLLEFRTIDRLLVELPIEVLKRCRCREVGVLYPSCNTPFAPRIGRDRQESLQQAQSRQLLFLRRGDDFIQLLGAQRGFQRFQILEDSPTLPGRITFGCRRARRCFARSCLLRRCLVVRPACRRHGCLPR